MEWRHGNTACQPSSGNLPKIRFGKIITQRLRIKNNLGNHAIGPLMVEEGCDLLFGFPFIEMGISEIWAEHIISAGYAAPKQLKETKTTAIQQKLNGYRNTEKDVYDEQ